MKCFICFFVIFAIGMIFTQKAVSAPDTVSIAVKVDSNKTSSGMISVDKEAFTTALNSANATIEFLKWILGFITGFFGLIATVATAYFTWRAYQDKNKIKSLEERLNDAEKRATEVADSFKILDEKVQQTTERLNEAAGFRNNIPSVPSNTNPTIDAISEEPTIGV
ncbi:MAG: hypothetical protein ACOVSW_14310 [Candidatus Kapaibacteriota bacterium]|jgi:hypothetical protein